MARRTPQTFLKRQREQKRAEKARQKQAKREARKLGLVPEDTVPGDGDPSDLSAEGTVDGTDDAAAKATDDPVE